MNLKTYLYLTFIIFAFLLQVTYPSLDKDISTLEIVDKIEDVKLLGKKDPLAQHDYQAAFGLPIAEKLYSKRFTTVNDSTDMQHITEVGVPPPRA